MEKQIHIVKKRLKTEFPYLRCEGRFALCGQPQAGDLKEFKMDSWTHVVNLRSSQELLELDFEPSEIHRKLDLKYSHIPVIVNGDINKSALRRIHELLSDKEERGGCKYVIHCASGVRAALALMSHFLFSKRWKTEELPALAEAFEFQKTNLLNRLAQIMEAEI